jgi:hypothetical protein
MEFDFDQCREILFSGLVDALEINEGAVRSFGEDPNGTITGVSFDILPWHRFVALSFRTSSDDFVLLDQKELDVRYSPADWKHYEFIGDGSFDEVREYTGSVYPMSGGTAGQESMPSRYNFRQMHSAGRQSFRQNWGRIKGSADAAGFALGAAGAKAGYTAGSLAGPAAGVAGWIIGHESPAAVTGVSRSGYYYGKGLVREGWRQFRSNSRYRR